MILGIERINMCTYIDEEATAKMKKDLRDKKIAYAWKVVLVRKHHYEAPYQGSSYRQHNRINKKLLVNRDSMFRASIEDKHRLYVTDGAFHLSLTNPLATLLCNYLRKSFCDEYEIVKVSFKPTDIVYVGDCGLHDKSIYNMPPGPDTVCVRAFSFVDQFKKESK